MLAQKSDGDLLCHARIAGRIGALSERLLASSRIFTGKAGSALRRKSRPSASRRTAAASPRATASRIVADSETGSTADATAFKSAGETFFGLVTAHSSSAATRLPPIRLDRIRCAASATDNDETSIP